MIVTAIVNHIWDLSLSEEKGHNLSQLLICLKVLNFCSRHEVYAGWSVASAQNLITICAHISGDKHSGVFFAWAYSSAHYLFHKDQVLFFKLLSSCKLVVHFKLLTVTVYRSPRDFTIAEWIYFFLSFRKLVTAWSQWYNNGDCQNWRANYGPESLVRVILFWPLRFALH